MKYSIDWLKQQVEKGLAVDYYFFWGHTPRIPGVIDKACLSQWFPSAFVVDNVLYHTAEHWMMAQKAILFKDTEALSKILEATKPGAAKALGRKVRNFDATLWNELAYNIVVEGNIHKFSQHEELKTLLVNTGNKIIVEASPMDFIWGIGLSQNAKDTMDPFNWKGTNWLGFALMQVRDELLKQHI